MHKNQILMLRNIYRVHVNILQTSISLFAMVLNYCCKRNKIRNNLRKA